MNGASIVRVSALTGEHPLSKRDTPPNIAMLHLLRFVTFLRQASFATQVRRPHM
jgi:hypothetical protein